MSSCFALTLTFTFSQYCTSLCFCEKTDTNISFLHKYSLLYLKFVYFFQDESLFDAHSAGAFPLCEEIFQNSGERQLILLHIKKD